MSIPLQNFRSEFLKANTWAQRKEGVPLDLLDALSPSDLKIAEAELIEAAGLGDSWPILGLAHIRSVAAVPKFYQLLAKASKGMKVTIAYAIFRSNGDPQMIRTVLDELPLVNNQYELIDLLYLLPGFNDPDITKALQDYQNDKEYLVAYNATRAQGLPTDDIVKRAQQQNKPREL